VSGQIPAGTILCSSGDTRPVGTPRVIGELLL
jgi:hypothetical protein